jgi:hypothetical protein
MTQSGNFWILSYIFMAWYLVKHRDNSTFYLFIHMFQIVNI